eukprot:COSAG02_NODE_1088_length_14670_cov_237.088326_16_plen_201_part_00
MVSVSGQQATASYHSQRARAVTVTKERRPTHVRTSVLAAEPPSWHAESATADLAASDKAVGTSVLPIEGVRTYAPGISTGAVTVFVCFSAPARPIQRDRAAGRARPPIGRQPLALHDIKLSTLYTAFCRTLRIYAGAWLSGSVFVREQMPRCPIARVRFPTPINTADQFRHFFLVFQSSAGVYQLKQKMRKAENKSLHTN